MIFPKPYNMTFTDMCIWVDQNAYKENVDVNTLYQYFYHIALILSKNKKLFNKYHYYDDFAIFCANKLYFRYTNKKQYELDENNEPKLKKIKSVVNYLTTVLYPLKVDFEQSEYCQSISKEPNIDEINYNFNNLLSKEISGLHLSDFKFMLEDVGKTCKSFLSTLPFDTTSVEWLNIYISVMLTFLSYITLPCRTISKFNNLEAHDNLNFEHVEQGYQQEGEKKAILFHLPDSMSNYITVLARQLKSIVAKDLSYILHTKVTYDFISIQDSVNQFWNETQEVSNDD